MHVCMMNIEFSLNKIFECDDAPNVLLNSTKSEGA